MFIFFKFPGFSSAYYVNVILNHSYVFLLDISTVQCQSIVTSLSLLSMSIIKVHSSVAYFILASLSKIS